MEKQGNKTSYEASGMTMERGKNQSNLANFLRVFLRPSIYMETRLPIAKIFSILENIAMYQTEILYMSLAIVDEILSPDHH